MQQANPLAPAANDAREAQSPKPTVTDVLVVQALAGGYGANTVFADVNLRIKQGEICAILGQSGCGKSTLIKHFVGLLQPQHGTVQLLGANLARTDEAQREAILLRTGMLFQSGALINTHSVVDNVALPLIERAGLSASLAHDIARFKLELVGMGHASHLTPPELSGGMKKRAALARAMALDPQVLFCDEPSAGLDPVMAADLDNLLLHLRDQFGMAIVVVSHEVISIRTLADHALMLNAGRVIATGTLAEVEATQHSCVRSFFGRDAAATRARQPSLGDALTRSK